jgi:hypothetical protein
MKILKIIKILYRLLLPKTLTINQLRENKNAE